MDKFSVLPTDERFLNLFEEQKWILFEGINSLPDVKDLKKVIQVDEQITEVKRKSDNEVVSAGLVKRMQDLYRSQGMKETEIQKLIKRHVEGIRTQEIKNLEKLRHG